MSMFRAFSFLIVLTRTSFAEIWKACLRGEFFGDPCLGVKAASILTFLVFFPLTLGMSLDDISMVFY